MSATAAICRPGARDLLLRTINTSNAKNALDWSVIKEKIPQST